MKPFHTHTMSLMALALALSGIGCGSGGGTDDIEAKIGGRAIEIKTFTASFFPVDNMTPTVFLSSSEGGPCPGAADESSFTAQLTLGVLADVPLDTPIDVEGEKSPVTATADAHTGKCGFTAGSARKVRGTVTFTALEEWNAEGSIDLRIEGAEDECGALTPTTIEYKWSSFSAPSYNHEGCE